MIPPQLIHPMIVHFPIVFFLMLAVFDVVAAFLAVPFVGRSAAGNASAGLAILAGVAAPIAYFFGDLALDVAEAGGFHSEIAEIHEALGETTAAAFAVWALVRLYLWWRDTPTQGFVAIFVPILEIAGAVLVITTAYFGGRLVYDLGVNVAHGAM